MKRLLLKFSDSILGASEMKQVKGGYSGGGNVTCYRCEQHFHTGGQDFTKNTTVHTTSLSSAESTNDMCTVNGTSCYTHAAHLANYFRGCLELIGNLVFEINSNICEL